MNPPSPMSQSVCCAAGGIAPMVGRRDRSQPQTRPAAGGRTGDDDVIAVLENCVQLRRDISAFADNSLDDGSAADLVLDRLDRSARAGGNAIGPRLEFAIGEILGL